MFFAELLARTGKSARHIQLPDHNSTEYELSPKGAIGIVASDFRDTNIEKIAWARLGELAPSVLRLMQSFTIEEATMDDMFNMHVVAHGDEVSINCCCLLVCNMGLSLQRR